MTSFKKPDCESIKCMIPLYIKGNLSIEQKAEIERALMECPELRRELEEWEGIKDAYHHIEKTTISPSKNIYSKIISVIKIEERPSFFERAVQRISFKLSPAFSVSVIAVQFLIVIMLGITLLIQQNKYRTLSATYTTQEELIRINVVFKEKTHEVEIRNLLLEINAKIIDGPYSSGLYVIGIPSEERIENTLKRLRESEIVVLSERSY